MKAAIKRVNKSVVEVEGVILNIARRIKVNPRQLYKRFYMDIPLHQRGKFRTPAQFNNYLKVGRIKPNLKTLTNKQFVKNKALVKKYGLKGDWDRDDIPNYKDCMPFNYMEQGLLSNIGNAIGGAVNRAIGSVKGRSQSSANSLNLGSGGISPGLAIGSAVGGGVIRQGIGNTTYVDRNVSPAGSIYQQQLYNKISGSPGGSSGSNAATSATIIEQQQAAQQAKIAAQRAVAVAQAKAAAQLKAKLQATAFMQRQKAQLKNNQNLSNAQRQTAFNSVRDKASQIYQAVAQKEYQNQLKKMPLSKISLPTQSKSQDLSNPSSSSKPQNQTQVVNMFDPQTYMDLVNALQKSAAGINKSSSAKDKFKKLIEQPLIAVSSFTGNSWAAVKTAPANVISLIKNPANITKIPGAIYSDLKDTIQLLKVPNTRSQAIGKIGSYYFLGKLTDGGFKITGHIVGNAATKLSPKFVGVAKAGAKLKLPKAELKGTRDLNLKVVRSIPKESLAAQVGRSGKRVNAISSQADSIIKLIRNKKVVRKPIPNEAKLPATTKTLLKKFDTGKLKASELIRLDKALKKSGNKGILERSFFADPNLRIRPSRLGISKNEGSLIDLLSGNAKLKSNKPQILLFEDVKIQNLPKSLSDVKVALKSGRALTKSQTARLLQYQQKISGKFKPVGFVTRESEITLAPGEVIKRVKKVGVTLVDGKRVPIISARVVKPKGKITNLLKKAEAGKISTKELKILQKSLKKETGFKYSSSSIKNIKKTYPLGRKISSLAASRVASTFSFKKSAVKYTSGGQPYVKTSSGVRFISKSSIPSGPPSTKIKISFPSSQLPISRPSTSSSGSSRRSSGSTGSFLSVGSSGGSSGKKNLRLRASGNNSKKGRQDVIGFNVYGKSKGKYIKLNKIPLSSRDAQAKLLYLLDNTTSASGKIVPAGKIKKLGVVSANEINHYQKAKKKFRDYRIIRKRARNAGEIVIEKQRFRIDTPGEKKGLSLARAMQRGGVQESLRPRTATKKRTTPIKRPVPQRRKAKISRGAIQYKIINGQRRPVRILPNGQWRFVAKKR